MSRLRFLLSGMLAGVITAVGFAALHHLLISDIWFSLPAMMGAGAGCGLCLAWSYAVLFEHPRGRTWLLYTLAHLGAFLLLGAVSIALYDPIATIGALLAANEPPRELMRQALPLTVVFTLAAAAALSLLWGRTPAKAAAVLVTCVVLVTLFGVNVSVLGLVDMRGGAGVVVEFLGLVAAILLGNAGVFFLLERRGAFELGSGDADQAVRAPQEAKQPQTRERRGREEVQAAIHPERGGRA